MNVLRQRFVGIAVGLLICCAATGAVQAQAPTVDVRADVSDSGLRVMVTFSRPTGYALSAEEGRLVVLFDEPVTIRPSSKELADLRLTGYRAENDRQLIFDLGQSYRGHDDFELRNPLRLILDFRGGSALESVPETTTDPLYDDGRPVVVIDPGHGGVEDGAIGPGGLKEKEVTLEIARMLRSFLRRDRDVNVVLTRDEDRLVGLEERAAIANHNRADLFVSIHLNASPRRSAKGAETYYLSMEATDDEARALATLENEMAATIRRESGLANTSLGSSGLGSEDGLELVLWELAQNRHLEESSRLAERVQTELNRLTGSRNRGVRQAPFRVLVGATMPAILVEAGFISNADEERQFRSDEYRMRVATALANAIGAYLDDLQRLRPVDGLSAGGRE